VVLYGCENCSLTLREEYKLRVFNNRVLKRIFGPKGNEVTGGWRKLHNKELRHLYSSLSFIRIIMPRGVWAAHVARMGEKRTAYRSLVGKPEGQRPYPDSARFSSSPKRLDSGTHPASYPTRSGDSHTRGLKRQEHEADYTPR
jgi:hypothetical protein